jgi:hypothetical protein
MDGWCKPVSSVVVFPRMFLNCASEAGPEKLLPATIQRKVEGDATGVAHPDDGHEGASAHAIVCVGVVNRYVALENREINDEPMSP